MNELYIEPLEIPIESIDDLNKRFSNIKEDLHTLVKMLITRLQNDEEALFYISQISEAPYREDYVQRLAEIIWYRYSELPYLIRQEDNLYESLIGLVNAFDGVRNYIPQHHFVYELTDGFDYAPDNTNALSLIGFVSSIGAIVKVVNVCNKYTASDLEREILAASNPYLRGGLVDAMKTAKDVMVGHVLGDFYELMRLLIEIFNNRRVSMNPHTDTSQLEENVALAALAYDIHNHQCPPANLYKMLNAHPLTFNKGIVPCRFSLAQGLKGVIADDGMVGYLIFRGTNNLYNVITDIHQIMYGPDITYLMAIGLLDKMYNEYGQNREIHVIGHSLGGGLAQFATGALSKPNIHCDCYNSAGLSDNSMSMLVNLNHSNVQHIHLENDIVFKIGNQLGEYKDYACYDGWYKSHMISTIRNVVGNDHEYWVR